MVRELKIAHAADLHLDSPFARLPQDVSARLIEEQRAYLGRLVDACLEADIDILLLAGDVFDRPDASTLWVNRLADALRRLDPIDVYIVPGNHDPAYPGSVWDRGNWSNNVHIFKEAGTIEHPHLPFDLTAYPFTGLREHASLDDFEWADRDPSRIQILMLHGELIAGQASQSAYNPIPQRHEAFKYFDYVALGHVHQANTITGAGERSPLIRYPGCPQGRGFDELGDKGFWIETVTRSTDAGGRWQTHHQSAFISLDTCRFLIEPIDLSGIEDERSLSVFLQSEILRLKELYGEAVLGKACLRLLLRGRLDSRIDVDLAALQDEALAAGLSYVEIKNKTKPDWPMDRLREENGFFGVLVRNFDAELAVVERSRKDAEEKAYRQRLLEEALNYALEAGETQS